MEAEGMIYFKCTACSECFMTEEVFFAHSRTWHCKILVSEGQDPCDRVTSTNDIKEENVSATERDCDVITPEEFDDCLIVSQDITTPVIKSDSNLILPDDGDIKPFFGGSEEEHYERSAERFAELPFLSTFPSTFPEGNVDAVTAHNYQYERNNSVIRKVSQKKPHSQMPLTNMSRPSGVRRNQSQFLLKTKKKLSSGITPNSHASQVTGTGDLSSRRITVSGYSCSFCGKICKTATDYRRHERVHTGERPYECDICRKQFRLSHHLKAHKSSQHNAD